MNPRVLAFALLVAMPTPLLAQTDSARAVMTRGIRAYQDLDLDLAATLLRRALSGELSDTNRIAALMYLGAAEYYRWRKDSATAVFRRLVVLAPRHRPDSLVFPPEITRLYSEVQQGMQTALPVDVTKKDSVARQPPTPVSASQPHELPSDKITATGAGTLVNVHAESEAGGLPPASGTVLGLRASARYGRYELGVRYMEGSLQSRDLVEGAAALRYVTTPWLTLHTGLQIRRYGTPAGDERWVTGQLGARSETRIVSPKVRAHALLWVGRVLSVNVPPGSGTTRGGEVGVTFNMTPGPFAFGLAYAADQASVKNTNRHERVRTLMLTAALRRR